MGGAARGLAFCARNGRWLLVAGLLLGIASPALAQTMAATIVPLIALLLFLAALRVGPGAAFPRGRALPRAMLLALLLQMVLPLTAGALLALAGVLSTVAGTGVVLVLAAAPLTGSPALAVMAGADPAPALRQLVLGTALLPLTAAPVFLLLPVFDDAGAIAAGALRLLGVVVLAGGSAMLARRFLPALASGPVRPMIDGLMALAMALVVIGLMTAVGPAILSGDPAVPGLLALAFALNLGPALALWPWLGRTGGRSQRAALPPSDGTHLRARRQAAALAIVAGNRNLALFLAALPPEAAMRLLLFVGLYQVPMYLTPLTLSRLFGGLRQESETK